MGAQGKTDPDL
uniref:Uncharacterized protein n=1 Tax=Anguilla anguilla TaxID=7936 RepID=A0A0E9PR70_ANGAN